MGKHRLQGRWFSPETSTVFVCQDGEVRCSKRGTVGKSKHREVQIGTCWDSRYENRYQA